MFNEISTLIVFFEGEPIKHVIAKKPLRRMRSFIKVVEAQAEYLVKRNTKHFPRSYAGVTVITPKEFFAVVKSEI